VWLLAPVATTVLAAGVADARAALAAGRYAAAYAAASAVDTAPAQVLAARAAADHAVYGSLDSKERDAWLKRARVAAKRATELDPNDAEAYVQLARAKGEGARNADVLENVRLVGELKDLFDRALGIEPDNADALAGLAMWNLELSQRGVGWLFGASRDRVVPLLEKAVAAAPDQINLRVEYAVALRALGEAAAADAKLREALAMPAVTAADRFEQKRAAALLKP
jgi:tetratricopeptide (TPR) repeat protein